MGKLKDRNQDSKNKASITIRIPKHLKQNLSKNGNMSDNIRKILESQYLVRERMSSYECDKCGSKIKVGDLYYVELADIERFVSKDELEVLQSIPEKILCFSCAGTKLKKFDNKDEDVDVKFHDR